MANPATDAARFKSQLERLMAFSAAWTIGSMLEPDDRVK